jgi:hypothetical protein
MYVRELVEDGAFTSLIDLKKKMMRQKEYVIGFVVITSDENILDNNHVVLR